MPAPNPRLSPIGLDIGARTVRAVQLISRPRAARRAGPPGLVFPWTICAATAFPRTQPGQPLSAPEARRIADVLARQGFLGRSVAVAPPDELVRTSALEVPPRHSGAPVDQIIRAEVAREHALAQATFSAVSWDVPAPARATPGVSHVMAAACPHEEAEAFLHPLLDAGLTPARLEPRSAALARASSPLLPAGDSVSLLLHLDEHAATPIVLAAGRIVSVRPLPECGSDALLSALRARYTLDDAGAEHLTHRGTDGLLPPPDDETAHAVQHLRDEHAAAVEEAVRAALAYTTYRYPAMPLAAAAVCGSPSLAHTVRERLGVALSLTCARLAPAALAHVPDAFASAAEDEMLCAALGLAMQPARETNP